jgi:hypothetical protein
VHLQVPLDQSKHTSIIRTYIMVLICTTAMCRHCTKSSEMLRDGLQENLGAPANHAWALAGAGPSMHCKLAFSTCCFSTPSPPCPIVNYLNRKWRSSAAAQRRIRTAAERRTRSGVRALGVPSVGRARPSWARDGAADSADACKGLKRGVGTSAWGASAWGTSAGLGHVGLGWVTWEGREARRPWRAGGVRRLTSRPRCARHDGSR